MIPAEKFFTKSYLSAKHRDIELIAVKYFRATNKVYSYVKWHTYASESTRNSFESFQQELLNSSPFIDFVSTFKTREHNPISGGNTLLVRKWLTRSSFRSGTELTMSTKLLAHKISVPLKESTIQPEALAG